MKAEYIAAMVAVLGSIPIFMTLYKRTQRPVYEFEPKAEDKFIAEVYTKYLSGGRTLNVTYHATEKEAKRIAKKNAQWFDTYGGIHPDVGIYWAVCLISEQHEKTA